MGTPRGRTWVDEVRERVRIEDVAARYTDLKRTGQTLRGPCPIHGGDGPNFAVFPDTNRYKCFVCDEQGDAFTLVTKRESLDFMGVARLLADWLGVRIPAPRARGATVDGTDERQRAERQAAWRERGVAAWHRMGVGEDSVRAFSLGSDGDWPTIPIFGSGDAPCGWLRVDAQGATGWHPDSTPESRLAMCAPKTLRMDVRDERLVVADSPLAAIRMHALGYQSVAAPADGWRPGRALLCPEQVTWASLLGVRSVAFLVGVDAPRIRTLQQALHETEVAMLDVAIQPATLALPSLRDSKTCAWVERLRDVDVLRSHLTSEALVDLFEVRVASVAAAMRRGSLSRDGACAKLRPALDAARRSGDGALYQAYMAWAGRALGVRSRWSLPSIIYGEGGNEGAPF